MSFEMHGEEQIAAPVETVWAMLNDGQLLQACIPNCERLDKDSDTEYTATVVVKIGPIRARFQGRMEMLDLNPPHSCTIRGEGAGGMAGFGKADAQVQLTPDGRGGTLLTFAAKATVGGKLAQLGSRMVQSTAKKLTQQFFSELGAIVARDRSSQQLSSPQ
jgi:carbon monoxide dehydrogenase subunit G